LLRTLETCKNVKKIGTNLAVRHYWG